MTEQEIWTQEDKERNKLNLQELVTLVSTGQALLFAGAGCSVNLGYPTWPKLINELETLIDEPQRNAPLKISCPTLYVDFIKKIICEQYGSYEKYWGKLKEIFKPDNKLSSYDQLNKLLVTMPFRGIVTSNYDDVLRFAYTYSGTTERICKSISINEKHKELVSDFILSLSYESYNEKLIAHLHGVYDYPREIILSDQEYQSAYAPLVKNHWSFTKLFLWTLFISRRLVFIGFSFEDLYFGKILEAVTKDSWRWWSNTHFAIWALPIYDQGKAFAIKTRALDLEEKFGIKVLFYLDEDGSHRELLKTMEEIAVGCGIAFGHSWIEEGSKRMIQ